MSHIFISYSRKDIGIAQKIVDALAASELDTWVDWKSIPKGEDWEQEIYHGIEKADAFLFLISPDSVHSKMCNKEIAHALRNGKRIIPIVIHDSQVDEFLTQKTKKEVSKRNWIFCRAGQDNFRKAIAETRKTIRTDYAWLKYNTELQVKALKWERTKDASRLLRGKELREAEKQLAEVSVQQDPQPTRIQREYILASQRQEIRTRRQIMFGLTMGMGIMVLLSLVAWEQRSSAVQSQSTAIAEAIARTTAQSQAEIEANTRATAQAKAEQEARVARAGQLAAQSLNQTDASLGLLLSLESLQTDITLESQNSMLYWLQVKYLRTFLHARVDNIYAISLSADGRILAAAGEGGIVALWDMTTYKLISQIDTQHFLLWSVSLSPDGELLAIGSNDGTVSIWNVKNTPEIIKLIEFDDMVQKVAFSPDGKLLVAAGYRGSLKLWDVTNWQELASLKTNSSNWDLAFSPDGTRLAVFMKPGIGLLEVPSLKVMSTIDPEDEPTNLLSLTFSPKQDLLAIGFRTGIVKIYSLEDARFIDQSRTTNGAIMDLAFAPDTNELAYGTTNSELFLWDIEAKKARSLADVHQSYIRGILFTPQGYLVAASYVDRFLSVWDLRTPSQIMYPLLKHEDNVLSVAFNQEGNLLASGSADETVVVWDVNARRLVGAPIKIGSDVYSLAFRPGSDLLAVGTVDAGASLWNVSTHKQIGPTLIADSGQNLWHVAFSPDGKVLATLGSSLILWDITTYKSHMLFREIVSVYGGNHVAFSPDGLYIAALINPTTIQVWSTRNYEVIGQLKRFDYQDGYASPYDISDIVFGADSKIVASADNDNYTVTLWDVIHLKQMRLMTFPYKSLDFVISLAFSPDGKLFAVGREDNAPTLFDTKSWQPIGQLFYGHPDAIDGVETLAFSPDSKILASGGWDNRVVLWSVDPQEWKEIGCRLANRNLTLQEWETYFPDEPYRPTCPNLPAETEGNILPTP